MEEQRTTTQFIMMTENVRASLLELERSRNNCKYHHETYTDSMLELKKQCQKLKLVSEDTTSERDDKIIQLGLMSKLISTYRLHTHDHNLALFRLRHSTSVLGELLQAAKTILTDKSPLRQSYEELELRSLIRRAESAQYRY